MDKSKIICWSAAIRESSTFAENEIKIQKSIVLLYISNNHYNKDPTHNVNKIYRNKSTKYVQNLYRENYQTLLNI